MPPRAAGASRETVTSPLCPEEAVARADAWRVARFELYPGMNGALRTRQPCHMLCRCAASVQRSSPSNSCNRSCAGCRKRCQVRSLSIAANAASSAAVAVSSGVQPADAGSPTKARNSGKDNHGVRRATTTARRAHHGRGRPGNRNESRPGDDDKRRDGVVYDSLVQTCRFQDV